MTEKIGLVKNPLTIIAIFAGIAEVSGTVILPFITDDNQAVFVWFLMVFPTLLIALFFLTLNRNSKVLYAPSDFQNEDNYLQIHRYDKAKREEVIVNVSKENQVKAMIEQVGILESRITSLMVTLNAKETVNNYQSQPSNIGITENNSNGKLPFEVFITDILRPIEPFLLEMKERGHNCIVDHNERYAIAYEREYIDHAAIWLGYEVPFEAAKDVVLTAKKIYPHLKYILIDGDEAASFFALPAEEKQVYVGGATKTAREYGLAPLSSQDFKALSEAVSRSDFYDIIRAKYPRR